MKNGRRKTATENTFDPQDGTAFFLHEMCIRDRVGAVCLIGKAEHTMLVGKLYDGAQVRTDTVIGRGIDQNRLCLLYTSRCV